MSEVTNLLDEFGGGTEVQSAWFKFNKVGDGIKGTLLSKRIQKSVQPTFPDQMICELKKADGSVWNVGISVKKSGTIGRLSQCKVGEIIAIVFESEGESAIKGGAKAKNLKVLTYGMDENFGAGEEVSIEEVPY